MSNQSFKSRASELWKSPTKFMIISYLELFQPLTNAELSKLTGKAKSTINEYLKDLVEGSFIIKQKVVESGKYYYTYKLPKDLDDKLDVDQELDLETGFTLEKIKLIADTVGGFTEWKKRMINIEGKFYKRVKQEISRLEQETDLALRQQKEKKLVQIFDRLYPYEEIDGRLVSNSFNTFQFLTPAAFKELQQKYWKMVKELQSTLTRENIEEYRSSDQKMLFFSASAFPVQEMLELTQKLHEKLQ